MKQKTKTRIFKGFVCTTLAVITLGTLYATVPAVYDWTNKNIFKVTQSQAIDYNKNLVLKEHYLTCSLGRLDVVNDFTTDFSVLAKNNYVTKATGFSYLCFLPENAVFNAYNDFLFDYETKKFETTAEVTDNINRVISYYDSIEHDKPFRITETNYYLNGTETSLEAIADMTNWAYYAISCTGEMDYTNYTITLNYMIVALEQGTYASADNSVVLTIGETNSQFKDVSINENYYAITAGELSKKYNSKTNSYYLGFTFGYDNSSSSTVYKTCEMVDYDTLSYNGVTLTKVVN